MEDKYKPPPGECELCIWVDGELFMRCPICDEKIEDEKLDKLLSESELEF
jgi:hypothetical protein